MFDNGSFEYVYLETISCLSLHFILNPYKDNLSEKFAVHQSPSVITFGFSFSTATSSVSLKLSWYNVFAMDRFIFSLIIRWFRLAN